MLERTSKIFPAGFFAGPCPNCIDEPSQRCCSQWKRLDTNSRGEEQQCLPQQSGKRGRSGSCCQRSWKRVDAVDTLYKGYAWYSETSVLNGRNQGKGFLYLCCPSEILYSICHCDISLGWPWLREWHIKCLSQGWADYKMLNPKGYGFRVEGLGFANTVGALVKLWPWQEKQHIHLYIVHTLHSIISFFS